MAVPKSIALFAVLTIVTIAGYVDASCVLTPILQGVSVEQPLGYTRRKIFPNEMGDCKQRCLDETSFACSAILWPALSGGDCFIMDKVNINSEIFCDDRSYILYVNVCDGAAVPSIGYCRFVLTQSLVSPPSGVPAQSPGLTTVRSCREFCIAKYNQLDCSSYIVGPNEPSMCTLFGTEVTNADAGLQDLYTKACKPPPENCKYTAWSEWTGCSAACGGGVRNRTRAFLANATDDGVPCIDSEKFEMEPCNTASCAPDCQYSAWSAFSTCSVSCGIGVSTRTRTVVKEADPGGVACDTTLLTQTVPCDTSGVPGCPALCDYTPWAAWSTCSASCLSFRTRTLNSGDPTLCEIENGPIFMEQPCTGGDCNPSTTTTSVAPDAPTTTLPPANETGCRIPNVDPASRPSSTGFKAVGLQANCAAKCLVETSFPCQAFTTTGANGPCILHGPIDRQTTILFTSKYYLQDIYCRVNTSRETSLCGWQMVRSQIDPTKTSAVSYTSLGYTINAEHCGTLCMMNHPMFKPNPCEAYAYSADSGFLGTPDNCYMLTQIADTSAINATGAYDLYKLVCYVV